jgi:hypothetical protein
MRMYDFTSHKYGHMCVYLQVSISMCVTVSRRDIKGRRTRMVKSFNDAEFDQPLGMLMMYLGCMAALSKHTMSM